MSEYIKQNFTSGQRLKADHLNHMEDGIAELSKEKVGKAQGTENADKLLYIGTDGNVAPLMLGEGLEVEQVAGKNIVHGEWKNGQWGNTPEGVWKDYNGTGKSHAGINELFPVKPGGTYTASCTTLSNATYAGLYWMEFNEFGEYLRYIRSGNMASSRTATVTVDEDTAFIAIYFYADGTSAWTDIIPGEFMIEEGNTATAYEPYMGSGGSARVKDYNTLMRLPDFTKKIDGIIDVSTFVNAHISTAGVFSLLTSGLHHVASPEYFAVLPGCTYNVEWDMVHNASAYANFYTTADESAFVSLAKEYSAGGDLTFTVPENANYVRFLFYASDITAADITPKSMKMQKSGTVMQDLQERVLRTDRIDAAALYEVMRQLGLVKSGQPIPDYYFANDYINAKCDRITELYNACAGNGDAFVFVSDQHWPLNAQHSPALMRYIAEKVNIPRVFNGGDTADKPSIEYVELMERELDAKIYHAPGNHDYFGGVDGHQLARIFDTGKSEQIGNAYRHYYYVDNPQQQIRYIVLNPYDTNAVTDPADTSVLSQYEAEQVTWLTDVALKVDEGWTVLVFTHCLYYGFGTEAALNPSPTGADNVISALDAATCDVACVIQGHMHLDRIKHTPGGIPVVATTCDKYMPWIDGETDMEPWITESRTAGTITEQAFDVVVLDKAARKLTFVRIGAPADNWTDGTSTGTVEERVVTY